MSNKRAFRNPLVASLPAILLVGVGSASVERKRSLLESSGFEITLAENICYAEMAAGTGHFDVAVFDSSVAAEEQASLARLARLRWPWMRLVSCGDPADIALFDASHPAESDLPSTLLGLLR